MIPRMATDRAPFELSVTLGDASFSASGEADLVLRKFAEFKALASPSGAPTAAKPRKVIAQAEPTPDVSPDVKSPTTLPLKPFLSRHKLRGNKEKAAAVLAWSAESGEKHKLTFAELETLWKRTGFKTPTNLTRDVRAAAKEGWLESEGAGKDEVFFIAGYGEGVLAGWVTEGKE
jgi:hypothetical protein